MRRLRTFLRQGSCCLALLLCGVTASAQSPRDAFGPRGAAALDAAIHTLWPGGKLEWGASLVLKRAGEPDEVLYLPGYKERRLDAESLFVTCVEFGSGRRWEEGIPSPTRARSWLLLYWSDSEGQILTSKVVRVRPAASRVRCRDTTTALSLTPGAWPATTVRAETVHDTHDGWVLIEWQISWAPSLSKIRERIPLRLAERTPLRFRTVERFAVESDDSGLVISGRVGGSIHRYECGRPCLVDAECLLEMFLGHQDK